MVKKELRCLAVLVILVSVSYAENCGRDGKMARHRFPWMVHFRFWINYNTVTNETKKTVVYSCGGAIISPKHVLTAKHCTEEPGQSFKFGYMKVGAYDINDRESFQEVKIEKALYPPEDNTDHDMAIVRLEEPLDLSEPTIGRVCLPQSKKEAYVGETVKSTGWGKQNQTLHDSTEKNVLNEVTLEVANETSNKNWIFTKVKVIKGVPQDPCVGDSGGPLIIKKNNRWNIIGTVNGQGYDCKTGRSNPLFKSFGVFNKVSPYLKWIKSVVKDDTGNEKSSMFGNKDGRSYPRCETVGGKDIGVFCVFPFFYKENTYSGCTLVDSDDGKPWCSTQVDSYGVHAAGQNKWGHCPQGCTIDSGKIEETNNEEKLSREDEIIKESGKLKEKDKSNKYSKEIKGPGVGAGIVAQDVYEPEQNDRCQGRKYGDQNCCTRYRPCNEGEGDCDSDDDCNEDLSCRKDNCSKFHSWYHPNDDCCERNT